MWLDVLVARLLEVKREGRLQIADAARRAILDAKSKVAKGIGAVTHAWSGKQGRWRPRATRPSSAACAEPRRRSRKTRARSTSGPGFLALCLVAVIGFGVWVLWPQSEDALYAKAKPLMESELATDWQQAQTDYIDELLERFPETKFKTEIEEFQLRQAIHRAEERIKNLDRFGREPELSLTATTPRRGDMSDSATA